MKTKNKVKKICNTIIKNNIFIELNSLKELLEKDLKLNNSFDFKVDVTTSNGYNIIDIIYQNGKKWNVLNYTIII